MKFSINKGLSISVAILVALTSCGNRFKPLEPRPAKTPKNLVTQFSEALSEGRMYDAVSYVTGTNSEKKAVEAIVRLIAAQLSFRNAFIKEYGQQAWNNFQDSKHMTFNLYTKGKMLLLKFKKTKPLSLLLFLKKENMK